MVWAATNVRCRHWRTGWISAIAPHIPADIATRGVRGLILHGEQDSKLPFALATAAAARLQALGVDHALHGYPADHTLTAAMQADFNAWTARELLSGH